MKKLILISNFLLFSLNAMAQSTPKLAFKEYEEYKPCNTCVDVDQWNNGNPKVNANATGLNTKNKTVNRTVNNAATQVKGRGKIIIGAVSAIAVAAITAIIITKYSTITNALSQ